MDGLVKKTLEGTFTLLPMDDIISGAGSISQLGETLARYGVRRALLVTGHTLARKTDLVARVEASAGGRIASVFSETKQHVPRSAVLAAAEAARACKADAVISFGGGSPNDTAKGVLLTLSADIDDIAGYDRQRIKFQYPDIVDVPSLTNDCVPLFAIPTTLSAGEFTHFVGITDEARRVKDLYIDKKLTAKTVFFDPELTLATPHWLWLSSGMRAVDHCIEAICSTTAHPFTDALAGHSLAMLARYLRESAADPADLVARAQSQVAAWMSVCGLANVTLGLSHGIGHQLGARCAVPHGHTSCVMLPATMRFNAEYTGERQGWIARILGVDTHGMSNVKTAEAAAGAVLRLVQDIGQPTSLREVGVGRDTFAAIAADALQDLIVATNPRPITSEADVVALLETAY